MARVENEFSVMMLWLPWAVIEGSVAEKNTELEERTEEERVENGQGREVVNRSALSQSRKTAKLHLPF